ncbi:MAG: hypothetical protein ABSA82_07250 [Thermacetogeniaceae bacterium]
MKNLYKIDLLPAQAACITSRAEQGCPKGMGFTGKTVPQASGERGLGIPIINMRHRTGNDLRPGEREGWVIVTQWLRVTEVIQK